MPGLVQLLWVGPDCGILDVAGALCGISLQVWCSCSTVGGHTADPAVLTGVGVEEGGLLRLHHAGSETAIHIRQLLSKTSSGQGLLSANG